MWDELAAVSWIDPTLITRKETSYMSVDIDHGADYGNTLTWTDKDNLKLGAHLVEIQMDWISQDLTRCCGIDEGAGLRNSIELDSLSRFYTNRVPVLRIAANVGAIRTPAVLGPWHPETGFGEIRRSMDDLREVTFGTTSEADKIGCSIVPR
jgi:hypothetical protein